jgi:hypothetical protein
MPVLSLGASRSQSSATPVADLTANLHWLSARARLRASPELFIDVQSPGRLNTLSEQVVENLNPVGPAQIATPAGCLFSGEIDGQVTSHLCFGSSTRVQKNLRRSSLLDMSRQKILIADEP